MAIDIKKFLDQEGVSTLWSKVAEEVAKVNSNVSAVDAKAVKNAEDIAAHNTRLEAAEGKIEALEAGTYDDSEVRGLIQTNTNAIAVLNGDASVTGSVAQIANAAAVAEVASVVAGADASFDTLKEIADWIANDTTGAAGMANDIAALEALVGDTAVATQISNAITAALKVEGADKYALASDLTALAARVKTLEDAGYATTGAVAQCLTDAKAYADSLAKNYDAAGAASTAEANAKAYADGLAVNYDAAGAAAQALVDAKAYSDANLATAKSYTDTEVAKIQALTSAEVLAAIANASATA